MARIETTSRTLYTFDELSESAKERALEKQAEIEGELWGPEDGYEDFVRVAAILGVEVTQDARQTHSGKTVYEPDIQYSGFWSQGDGASFTGSYAYQKRAHKEIRQYAPQDAELHRIADELLALQKPLNYGLLAEIERGHYGGSSVHSGVMDVDVSIKWDDAYKQTKWDDVQLPYKEVKQLMRDLADWLYKQLEADYDYRVSKESCLEAIEANEYEFDEDGNRLKDRHNRTN